MILGGQGLGKLKFSSRLMMVPPKTGIDQLKKLKKRRAKGDLKSDVMKVRDVIKKQADVDVDADVDVGPDVGSGGGGGGGGGGTWSTVSGGNTWLIVGGIAAAVLGVGLVVLLRR
jgi:hypothetical protein